MVERTSAAFLALVLSGAATLACIASDTAPGGLPSRASLVRSTHSHELPSVEAPPSSAVDQERYARPAQGWQTIAEEDFEGTFPAPGWQLLGNTEETTWGKRDCRPARGSFSIWSHGGGPEGSALPCGTPYPDNLQVYAVFGPFSLEAAVAAELELSYWAKTQADADYMLILLSTNAEDWNGWSLSGDSRGWTTDVLDLGTADVPGGVLGEPEVWLALGLETDASVAYEGVYFDDLTLRATGGTVATPTASASSPTPTRTTQTPVPGQWTTLLSEGFEGPFPGPGWSIDSTHETVFWGKRSCRAASGQFSAWAHGGGELGSTYTCGTTYPGDLETWLIYGPMSFADVTAAELEFSVWAIIQENEDPFRFMVSVDQETYYGWVLKRSTAGWYSDAFDLAEAAVPGGALGRDEVWLGFIFESDAGINFEGVHLDEIELRVMYGSGKHKAYLPLATRPVTSDRA